MIYSRVIFKAKFLFLFLCLLLSATVLHAEGTKQASPTNSANGAALFSYVPFLIGNQGLGSYLNCPDDQRIRFTITDSINENLYFGFQPRTYFNATNTVVNDAYYKIYDESGQVVAGPTLMASSTGQGYIEDYDEAVVGPNIGGASPTGYNPYVFNPDTIGDFYVEVYRSGDGGATMLRQVAGALTIPFFDFTVATDANVQYDGRIWNRNWAFIVSDLVDGTFSNKESSSMISELYTYTPDQFVVKLDYQEGFRPLGYNVRVNYSGPNNTGNFVNDRRSINGLFSAPSEGYKTFLSIPDVNVFPNGTTGSTTFTSDIYGCPGAYFIPYYITQPGDVALLLDLNGVPGYQAGTADTVFEAFGLAAGNHVFSWDGTDGLGAVVPPNFTAQVTLTLFQGRCNIPMLDVELNINGFSVSSIFPNLGTRSLYWDDSGLTAFGACGTPATSNDNSTGAGADFSGLYEGVMSPSHAWNGPGANSTTPAVANGGGEATAGNRCDDFGNGRIMNTWFYVTQTSSPVTAMVLPDCDKDGDGVDDNLDVDDDNDGIPDSLENQGLIDPLLDGDLDGIPNYIDPNQAGFVDSNFDGVDDRYDFDLDGVINSFDLDSDGDGMVDIVEAGGVDTVGYDGQIDNFIDTDNDGLADVVDTDNGGVALPLTNTDGAGRADYMDIDSDNDGIVDVIESQTTLGYIAPAGVDSDNDGLDNAYDTISGFGGTGNIPVNTDGLDASDYLDLDSDNDSFLDSLEGWDTDNMNGADIIASGLDADGDGLDDAYDNNDSTINPTNSQTPNSFPNIDNATTVEKDWRESLDTDGDGIVDTDDLDDDNDGILDTVEELANGGDTDGDGVPNRLDLDSDNDGINDVDEANGTDADGDGIADGVPNANGEPVPGGLTPPNTDGTGESDPYDTDSDDDGTSDLIEGGLDQSMLDSNNDGVVDDTNDPDNDGIISTVDGKPSVWGDSNVSPIAVNDTTSTTEDTTVKITLINNDYDVDGIIDTTTVDLDTLSDGVQKVLVTSQGTWQVDSTGELTFSPVLNFNDTAMLYYTVKDNKGDTSNVAMVIIVVTAVNDAPLVVNDTISLVEDSTTGGNLTVNDSDVETTLYVDSVPVVNASNGTFATDTNGVYTYTPTANFTGTDTVVVSVCDRGTPLPVKCANDTLFFVVTPVNDAPVAVSDTASTQEDIIVSITVTNNDTDIDGSIDASTVDLDTLQPGIQTVDTTSAGIYVVDNSGLVSYTPAKDFNGQAVLYYTVKDDGGSESNTAAIVVNITPVNDAPVISNEVIATMENTPITSDLTDGTDVDVDGNLWADTIPVRNASNGTFTVDTMGVYTYTPNLNFNGSDTVVVQVCDDGTPLPAKCGNDTLFITVSSVNNAPVAVNDTTITFEDTPVNITITNNDTDVDGTINTATVDLDTALVGQQLTDTTANGIWSVSNLGVLTFTPAANYVGSDSLYYTVQDNIGLISNTAQIIVTVTAVNDAPVAVNDTTTTTEDTPVTVFVAANDTDIDGTVNISTIDLDTTLANGQQSSYTTVAGTWTDSNTGAIIFTPSANFTGDAIHYYTIKDNNGLVSNTAAIVVNVTPVNDAPVISNEVIATKENTPVTGDLTDGTDVDVDGNLWANTTPVRNASNGTFVVDTMGVYTYTPNLNFNGLDTVVVEVCDDGTPLPAKCGNDTLFITVSSVNNAPVAVNDTTNTLEDNPVSVTITNNDTDVDGTINVATVDLDTALVGQQLTDTTANGIWSVSNLGVLTFTPNANFNGTETLFYSVRDNVGLVSNTALVIAEVAPVNDTPVVVNENISTTIGNSVTSNVLINDSDIETALVVNVVPIKNPTNGTFAIAANGAFTYTPNNNFIGNDTVVVSVCDTGLPLPSICVNDSIFITVSSCDVNNPTLDCDNDGLTNADELLAGSNPLLPDTDGDGVIDGKEVADGTSPTNGCEYLTASVTVAQSASWNSSDCDGDGVINATELSDATNPKEGCSFVLANATVAPSSAWLAADCDSDSLTNANELSNATNPLQNDTDGDGVLDGVEVTNNTQPLDNCDFVIADTSVSPSSEWNVKDCDGDGVINATEIVDNTNPSDPCDFVAASITLTVTKPCGPNFPKGFSPNNDNVNDYYVIQGVEQYPNNKFQVFNRWGNAVFEMSDYDNSWNGTTNSNGVAVGSEELPSAVYFYTFEYTKDNKKEVKTGYIYLKR